ncbi:MAG: fimbrillin family protein [Phocaeicola sp.]
MSNRFLLPIVALVLVISGCTKHDVLGHNDSEAADPTIVNFNASLASLKGETTTKDSFKEFYMYAYQGAKGSDTSMSWGTDSPKPLMDSEKVTKGSDNAWQSASLTPWPAEGTHVQFFAFSPAASDASGIKYIKDGTSEHKPALGFTAKTDVADQVDLLYAQSTEMVTAATGKHDKVNLKFTHALTKVKFSAKVQPNQELYISELSLHNLGSKGRFTYATGDVERGSWDETVGANLAFAVVLSENASTGITNTTAVDVTAKGGASLVIPQTREKVNVSVEGPHLFTGNDKESYIRVVYSLKNRVANRWIVGGESEQVTAYIPVRIDFKSNEVANFIIGFGTGNGGYDDSGKSIIDHEEMIQLDVKFNDWNSEVSIDVTPPPLPEKPKMTFTIMTSDENKVFTLPFGTSGTTGAYTLTVDWGDGTDLSVIKPWESLTGGIKHAYAAVGVYPITISSSEIDFNKEQIPRINASGNVMLKSIDTPLLNTGSNDFSSVFESCLNLEMIPADLFKYNTQVTNFRYVFMECKSLQKIPAGLFHYNRAANSFSGAFWNCYRAKVDPNIFCNEDTEKGTRFNSLAGKVDFSFTFIQVGIYLSEEEAKANIFPALWLYIFPDAGVVSEMCFENARMGNYLDVPADGSWGSPRRPFL